MELFQLKKKIEFEFGIVKNLYSGINCIAVVGNDKKGFIIRRGDMSQGTIDLFKDPFAASNTLYSACANEVAKYNTQYCLNNFVCTIGFPESVEPLTFYIVLDKIVREEPKQISEADFTKLIIK